MATNGMNGAVDVNGAAPEANGNAEMPYLSTQPSPNQDWRITLSGKVVAITGVS